jgi:glycosyltransferase involved in cell wall biosynthesis
VLYAADEWGGVGGTAGYIVMLARGLCRRGYRVAAICHSGSALTRLHAALRDAGVDVRTLDADDRGSPFARLRRLGWYGSLFREYQGAVLALLMGYHTRGGNAIVAGTLGGVAAIVRADLTPPEPPIGRRERLALRLKDALVNRVVVGAMDNVEAFAIHMDRSRGRMTVIHTGIELARFTPGADRFETRAALGYRNDETVIGTLSRLDDTRKGLEYFLDMAARVVPTFPNARFLIVGEGILRPSLEARAQELGVRDWVTFTGWRSDIPQQLAAMDVFVMPSLFEGGPTSVLEAMAMSRPVVATRVGMVPEVIEDGVTGLVVPPGDTLALVRAVTTLLSDAVLREQLATSARARAESSFSIETMVQHYLEVFADATRKHQWAMT